MLNEMLYSLLEACGETIAMVLVSGSLAILLGLPLGVLLLVTQPKHLLDHPYLYRTLSLMVNGLRSVPFIILLVAIIPFTRLLVGSSIGTVAAMVPLTVTAFPFVARVVENALQEVSPGLIEAGRAMGATPWQTIRKILLRESIPGIINGITLMLVTLVGYSSMAGVVGGGGLGDLAIRYGYERFNVPVMIVTVVILIIMVQLIQILGDFLATHFQRR
jgi:D-methionine transport system permease protein